MQDLGSMSYLKFLEVPSFPIGLSPSTMQDFGSVWYLEFLGVPSSPKV